MKKNPDWPSVSEPHEEMIDYNVSDGMGFISPDMSRKWAKFLGEGDEPLSGYNTRCAFLKGMVFTVPFVQFAEEVAHTYEITDAWGDKKGRKGRRFNSNNFYVKVMGFLRRM